MVQQFGGAERWAAELGVRFVRRKPGHAARWTESRVRDELREFLNGRTQWPDRREFEAAGRKPLRDAINRLGGVELWAAEVGLARPHLQSGSRRVFDEERIESDLRRFVGDRPAWPSLRDFEQAGLRGLMWAIYRHGGPTLWAARLGITPPRGRSVPTSRRGRRHRWTDEHIRAELARVCERYGGWPGEAGFAEDGRISAYKAASRYGGIAHWRAELGVAAPRGRR
jgi:hypothetical protein